MIYVNLKLGQKRILMLVTINTDASFSNKHHVATYAYWIACNDGKFFRSGSLKGDVYSPIHAEMKCIVNALQYVLNNKELKFIDKIIINTDCLHAIQKFQKPNTDWFISKSKPEIVKELNSIKSHYVKIHNSYFSKNPEKKKIIIEYRHIKAHKHINDARHYVNDLCDKEAKVMMGLLLKKIK